MNALDELQQLEQTPEFGSIRAAAVRQLREALTDVVTSVHRWHIFNHVADEMDARKESPT